MPSGHFPSRLADAEAKDAGGPRPFFPTRTWLNPGKFAGLLSQSMDPFFRLHCLANQSITTSTPKRNGPVSPPSSPPTRSPSAVPRRRPRRLLCLSDEKKRRRFLFARAVCIRANNHTTTPTRRPVSAPITAGACRISPRTKSRTTFRQCRHAVWLLRRNLGRGQALHRLQVRFYCRLFFTCSRR